MKRKRHCSRTVLTAVIGIAWGGCSQGPTEIAGPTPPPGRPGAKATRTYDYTHSIQSQAGSKLTRKFVIALVRFGEDRPVDDVPYGIEPDEKLSAVDISVDIQIGEEPRGMNRRARDVLKHELMETESFVLVERERILDIIREQKFGETRYVNPDTSPDIGQVMAVQYLLEGSIGLNEDRTFKETLPTPPSYKDGEPSVLERIFARGSVATQRRLRELTERRRKQAQMRQMHQENSIGVYLSLYDVRTSRIAAEAFGIGGNGLEAIRDAVEDLLDKCLDIPNPVCIAAIDGDRVFLDIGAEDRVQVGQRFRYVAPGLEIRNRAGQIIGRQDEEGGELEITRVDRLMSVASVIRRVSDPVVGAPVEPLD